MVYKSKPVDTLEQVAVDLRELTKRLTTICRSQKPTGWQQRGALLAEEMHDINLRLSALDPGVDLPSGDK